MHRISSTPLVIFQVFTQNRVHNIQLNSQLTLPSSSRHNLVVDTPFHLNSPLEDTFLMVHRDHMGFHPLHTVNLHRVLLIVATMCWYVKAFLLDLILE